jgi:hypothetical protein
VFNKLTRAFIGFFSKSSREASKRSLRQQDIHEFKQFLSDNKNLPIDEQAEAILLSLQLIEKLNLPPHVAEKILQQDKLLTLSLENYKQANTVQLEQAKSLLEHILADIVQFLEIAFTGWSADYSELRESWQKVVAKQKVSGVVSRQGTPAVSRVLAVAKPDKISEASLLKALYPGRSVDFLSIANHIAKLEMTMNEMDGKEDFANSDNPELVMKRLTSEMEMVKKFQNKITDPSLLQRISNILARMRAKVDKLMNDKKEREKEVRRYLLSEIDKDRIEPDTSPKHRRRP